ncbi:OmpA family protein [Spirillospora sp. NBC_00431]
MREPLCRAVVAAVLLLGALGCVDRQPVSTGCPWIDEPADQGSEQVTSRRIALLDLSASFWPKRGERATQPVDPVEKITEQLTADYGKDGVRLVSLAGFDGSSASLVQRLDEVALPVPTGSDTERGRESARKCLEGEVKALLKEEPQTPGSDPMAALAAAGSLRGDTPAGSTGVLMVTDGIGNAGCMDLRKVMDGRTDAAGLIGSCKSKDDLAKLEGVEIRLAGIGLRAGRDPLKSSEHAWLKSFWTQVCGELQARCVHETSKSATRRSTVERPGDPDVPFPDFDCNPCVLPEKLLFAFDSAELSPSASAYLGLLVGQLHGRKIVRVEGHTDSRGSVAHNAGLSRRRAEAVKARLAGAAAGAQAVGLGSSEPKCAGEYRGGEPDEECMAKNRRVEITLAGG